MRSLLLDEHVPNFYRVQLLRRRPELRIWMIGEPSVPPKGTLDPEILFWCEEHGFLLFTNNRNSMPAHLEDHLSAGHHVPGILVLRPRPDIGLVIEHLLLIVEASRDEDYQDLIEYLPLE